MEKQNKKTSDIEKFRADAEAFHLKKPAIINALKNWMSEPDALKLIHEIEINQIELELQNEEVIAAKEQALLSAEKYTEFFNLAPSGYLLLSKEGNIKEINFTAAAMLGKEQKQLLKQNFASLFSENYRNVVNTFIKRMTTGKAKEICEAEIVLNEKVKTHLHIDGIMSRSSKNYLLTLVDITQHKQTEEEIKNLKADLERSLEASQIGTWSHDLLADTDLTRDVSVRNLKHDQIFGFKEKQELWGVEKMLEFVIDEDKAYVRAKFENLYITNRLDFECRIRWKDQSIHWIACSGMVLRDKEGQAYQANGTVTDITERKLADEKIRESEERLRGLIYNLQDAYFEADLNGNFTFVSPLAASMYEYNSVEELMGMPAENLYADVNQRNEVIEKLKEKGSISDFTGLGKKKSGKIFWVSMNIQFKYDDKGQIAGTIGVVRDITERKLAEEESEKSRLLLHSIINGTSDAIFVKDTEGKYLLLNHAAEEFVGKKAEDVLGKDDTFLFPAEEAAILMNGDRRIIEEGKTATYEEYVSSKDKKKIIFLSTKGPLFDNNGIKMGLFGISKDITDIKNAEEALQESEERFQLLFNKAPMGYQSLDFDGNFIEVNQQWLETLGYKKEEVIGKWFGDFLTPAYQDGFRKRFPLFKAQGFIHSEFEMQHKSGNVLFIAFEGRIGYDTQGEFKQTHCILQDITEKRKAENALIESENKLKAVLESTADGILAVDADGKIISTNQRFYELWHIPSQLIETNDDKRLLTFVSDQLINPEQFLKKVQSLYNSSEEDFDILQFKDGRCFERYSKPFESTTSIKGRVWSFRDITERMLAEEKVKKTGQHYQALIEKAPDGIALIDAEGNFKYVSPAAKKMFGYGETDEDFDNPAAATHPDDLQMVLSELGKLMANPSYIPTIEYRYIDKHGNWHWVETTFSNLLANPSVESIVLNFREITERKKLEEVHNFLSTSAYLSTGITFFESLAKFLAEILDSEYVCIDRLEGDGLTAHTIAIYNEGKFDSKVSYSLEQTPCGDLAGKTICCFPENVCRLFPNDKALQDLKAESYIGTTLWSFDGKAIGLIAIIGQKPLKNADFAENVLRLVAIRASGELERQQAENILKENNSRLELAMNTTNMAWWQMNISNGEVIFDKRKTDMLGYTPEKFQHYTDFTALLHPEDQDKAMDAMRRYLSGKVDRYEVEYRILTNTGEYKWFYDIGASAGNDANGNPQFITGLVIDISERKQSEAALQESNQLLALFVKHSPIYTFIKDVSPDESRVLIASDNMHEITGISGADMVGKNMYELFPAEFAEKMTNDDWKVVSDGKMLQLDEDFNDRYYITIKFPIILGGTKKLAGYTIDITDMKKVENEIIEKSNELERFNNLMVGREIKMVELKKEINGLLKRLGENEKYVIVSND